MKTKLAIAALAACLAVPLFAGQASQSSASESCPYRAPNGDCIDDPAPATGQYGTAADQIGASHATNIRSSQAHANVKLTEATYVFAHGICRWVDNPGSHGAGIFVGLEAKSEWTSFIGAPPAGVSLQYCCQPATVSICGKPVAIPFGVAGKSYGYSDGYDFKATYTCGANLNGIAPTADTSWTVTTSGSCAAPAQPPACDAGPKEDSIDCGGDGDGPDRSGHDNGSSGSGGHNGDGPGSGGG